MVIKRDLKIFHAGAARRAGNWREPVSQVLSAPPAVRQDERF
jgi:hypothetical protein